jgi:biopolymer transport protein ExbB
VIEDILAILQKGGYVLIPIFIVAQIGWYLIIERIWFLRKMSFSQKPFWRQTPESPDKWKEYIQKQKSLSGIFGSIVHNISSRYHQGEKAMVYAVKEVLNERVPALQKHMSTIAIMAASAPLLGLLGTVTGMVTTFKVITQYGVGNPAMMAEGISEALLTTQAGLIVGFPLVLMHNYLLNKADEIETECISGATRLINELR